MLDKAYRWSYNPNVAVGFIDKYGDMNELQKKTVSDVVDLLKRIQNRDAKQFSMMVYELDENDEVKQSTEIIIRHLLGKFYIKKDGMEKEYTFFNVSNMVFKSFFENKYGFLDSIHVSTFADIINGMRAPRGFWNDLTPEERFDINHYIVYYLLGIQNQFEAINVTTKDLMVIPGAFMSRGEFSIFGLVSSVFPLIQYWEMKNFPRGMLTEAVMLEAVEYVLRYHNISIDELRFKTLMRHCPAVYRKLGSIRKIRTFYYDMKFLETERAMGLETGKKFVGPNGEEVL